MGHESVRDVQFSPFYPNYFAAGYDNGNVQVYNCYTFLKQRTNNLKDLGHT